MQSVAWEVMQGVSALPRIFPDAGMLTVSQIVRFVSMTSRTPPSRQSLAAYSGLPHGMPTSHVDLISADLLKFIST
jgi:hypothetical protein